MTCIDLRERFGDPYKIGHDEAAATWGERREPWMQTIPCRLGMIYPHGGIRLAVEVDHHPGAARKLAAIPGITIHQDGGWHREMTFLFHVDLFDAVAKIVRPRRRRRLAAEQRQTCAERLAKVRLNSLRGGDPATLERDPRATDDPKVA
jgi:hypothetical protein